MVEITKGYGGGALSRHNPDKFEVMKWLEDLENCNTWGEFWFSSKLPTENAKRVWNNYQMLKDEIKEENYDNGPREN